MSTKGRVGARRRGRSPWGARALGAASVAVVWASAGVALAQPMPARDTAYVLGPAKWRAGLFAPLEIGIGHGAEVSSSIVPQLMLAPNVALRVELGKLGPATITGEYGLALPTQAARLVGGYLFPSFANGLGQVGWSLVPAAGLWVSGGERGVLTGRLETSIGIPLGDTSVRALDTFAPVELIFAPTLNGYRVRIGGMYDYAVLDWLRARAGVNGYMIGASPFPPRSPFYFSAEAALEVALGRYVRLSAGAIYYNYDQRATALETDDDGHAHRVSVRSNDVFPTFDVIVGSR